MNNSLTRGFINCVILIISACLLLPSCGDLSGKYYNHKYRFSDSVVKDIPLDKNETPVPYYNSTKQQEKLLKLNSLEEGYDSLQIRIWGNYAYGKEANLFVISYNGKWHAELVTLIFSIDPKTRKYVFTNSTASTVNPRSGWEVFANKLFQLQVLTLPDMSKLNLGNGEDGAAFSVEIGTANSYRFYGYWSPEVYANQYWQCKSMTEIIKLVESEFGFNFKPKISTHHVGLTEASSDENEKT